MLETDAEEQSASEEEEETRNEREFTLVDNDYLSPAAAVWTFSHSVYGVFLPV